MRASTVSWCVRAVLSFSLTNCPPQLLLSLLLLFPFPDDQLELLGSLIASGERVGLAMEQVEILKANVEASGGPVDVYGAAACCHCCCCSCRSPGLLPAQRSSNQVPADHCGFWRPRFAVPQALLWARKVRALLARLPDGTEQQPGEQERQQQQEQQPEAQPAPVESEQQVEAAVAEVQQQLIDAVAADEEGRPLPQPQPLPQPPQPPQQIAAPPAAPPPCTVPFAQRLRLSGALRGGSARLGLRTLRLLSAASQPTRPGTPTRTLPHTHSHHPPSSFPPPPWAFLAPSLRRGCHPSGGGLHPALRREAVCAAAEVRC